MKTPADELLEAAKALTFSAYPAHGSGFVMTVQGDLAAFEAAISNYQSQDGWRDMASAPRDGTWVDLWSNVGGGCRVTARWVNETREVPSPNCVMDGWKDRSFDHYSALSPEYITHWMPLPPPPHSNPEAGG